jgi:hypothetical protein
LELIEDSNGKHNQNRAKIKDINAAGWIEAKKVLCLVTKREEFKCQTFEQARSSSSHPFE